MLEPVAGATTWVGTILGDGRYRITRELGGGGMALVYLAHDQTLDCQTVIKTPHAALLADPQFAERFTREIRALVALSHPHIVKITDVGRHEATPYAVMQFLGGGDLNGRRRRDPSGRPLPQSLPELLDWLPKIAAALDFIHKRNFIHRDVKPANILYDEHGNAYLSDFGVAKALHGADDVTADSSLTGSGMVLGTPDYLAPEVILGERFDGRVDQYALAITAYELLSGRLPFVGPTPSAVLVLQTTRAAAPLGTLRSDLPAGVSETVARAMSKNPAERFATCGEFVAALQGTLRGGSTAAALPQRSATPTMQALPVDTVTPQATAVGAAAARRVACPQCGAGLALPADMPRDRSPVCPRCRAKIVLSAWPATLPAAVPAQATLPTAAVYTAPTAPTAVRPSKQTSASNGNPSNAKRILVIAGGAIVMVLGIVVALMTSPSSSPESPAVSVPTSGSDVPRPTASAGEIAPQTKLVVNDVSVDFDEDLSTTAHLDPPAAELTPQFSFGKTPPRGVVVDEQGTVRWPADEFRSAGMHSVVVRANVGKQWSQERVVVLTIRPPPQINSVVAEPAVPIIGRPLRIVVGAQRADGLTYRSFEYRLGSTGTWQRTDVGEFTLAAAPNAPFTIDVRPAGRGDQSAIKSLSLTPARDEPPPGTVLENSIGMQLVFVPGGDFSMGSPTNESTRSDDEAQHAVKISHGFYIGKFEVTQQEYTRVVLNQNPSRFSARGSLSNLVRTRDTSRFPVENVTWIQADDFCKRLGQRSDERREGRRYRLPTEAEWEYAARAGTTTPYCVGATLTAQQATFSGPAVAMPSPVGMFAPNAWGLHDVHGNVWEWCADFYDKTYDRSAADAAAIDPRGPTAGTMRVHRGGAWDTPAASCRTAYRHSRAATESAGDLGFRVVLEQ